MTHAQALARNNDGSRSLPLTFAACCLFLPAAEGLSLCKIASRITPGLTLAPPVAAGAALLALAGVNALRLGLCSSLRRNLRRDTKARARLPALRFPAL